VEGILIHGKPATFAGCRKNVGLGRSVASAGDSTQAGRRTGDNGMSSGRMRRGTSSACARRTHSSRQNAQKALSALEDTSFTRSRDPCTSIGTQLQRRKSREVSRAVWYRGRANLRKQEEPAPRSNPSDEARLAARHRIARQRAMVVRDASEKEGGHGHRPCEETRTRVGSSVRRMQLQKSAGSILASNKLARSAPKRVTVRVNGGLGGTASGTKVSSTGSANGWW